LGQSTPTSSRYNDMKAKIKLKCIKIGVFRNEKGGPVYFQTYIFKSVQMLGHIFHIK